MTEKLILIDGSGFIFRAYHAMPPLRRADGVPVGAVYGFCNMLFRFLEALNSEAGKDHPLKPTHWAVVFDTARKTFRQDIYPEYKAHRPDVPEDLIPQFPLMREVCKAFNIPSLELEGYEADDLMATYAEEAKKQGISTILVSSDKDLMQLVDGYVGLWDPIKNVPLGTKEVFEKFGVSPSNVVDVQALAGDSSDNVPGVPGIGIKTAAELIQTFGSLENLLDQAETIKQPKRRQALLDNKEIALMSKDLVTLRRNTPLPSPLHDLIPQPPNPLILKDFLRHQGFTTLVSRVEKTLGVPTEKRASYETVLTDAHLERVIQACKDASVIAIDCETTGLQPMVADLVGISLSWEKEQGVYIPLRHKSATPQLSVEKVRMALSPLFTDPSILKVGHNLKYDMVILNKEGFIITPHSDTLLLSYVLDGAKNPHNLDDLAQRHLGYTTVKFTDVAGTGKSQKTFDEVEISVATNYAAEDTDITLRLYHLFTQRLTAERMVALYERVERPLVPVIAQMETNGIAVNRQVLYALSHEFSQNIAQIEREIYALAGKTFNIGSPKQLSALLFEELGLPAPKKSKTGSYVTDVDVLEKLVAQGHVLPEKILAWRQLSKLKSTYTDGLLNAINPKTGRIHTSYSLVGTTTGRLASSDPNLQNIPIRTENGRRIRQAFYACEGHLLLSLDYSQIELRLLAHMAHVPSLKEAFLKGVDIHKATASEIFSIPLEEVTSEHRRHAKAINFGIIYGISPYGLSQQLSISTEEARNTIKTYFAQYPGIQEYMEEQKEYARTHGFVRTLMGRKCFVPGIQDSNGITRQFAERQAINAPLQGSNADIIKMAMNRIQKLLKQEGLHGRLLLQVHDELIFEVPTEEIEPTQCCLKTLMENIITLKVPLIVGVGVGKTWDEAH